MAVPSDIIMLYVDKLHKLHIKEAVNSHFGKSKIIGMRQYNRFKIKTKATIQMNSLFFIAVDFHGECESLITQEAKADIVHVQRLNHYQNNRYCIQHIPLNC